MVNKKRVVSGIRPTGKLHLGNYFGAIENWLDLQKKYDCFFLIVDWHALTTDYKNPGEMPTKIKDMAIDLLSCGIDPQKSTLFVQSHVKEHAELFLLLSMLTPISWLERNPTFKDQVKELADKEIANLGFLGYPVLQTADILIYDGETVPVGKDQLPYLEVCREITRRFNYLYGETFKEPQSLLTNTPLITGVDGRKMSKSYDNAIYLADEPKEFERKILTFITDPSRKRRTDPGDPKDCPAFQNFHKRFMDKKEQAQVTQECTTAAIGCIDCKKRLLLKMNPWITPIREKRKELLKDENKLYTCLKDGRDKAQSIAQKTMTRVRSALKIT